jgi:hypothetical protein
MDDSAVINMGVNDDEYSRVGGANDTELSWIAFELRVSDGEDGGGMVFVEDLVGHSCSIDAALDFDVGVAVGFGKIRRKTTVIGGGQWSLKEGSRDVIATEMELLLVATLDSSGQDSIDGEEE